MNSQSQNDSVDAVIVLANLMDSSGRLNSESSARAEKAVEAYKNLHARTLVTCGWAYRDDSAINIADAFKEHIVREFGVQEQFVVAETSSRDTVGDAYFTKTVLALPRRWKRICVVTSDYHVERTSEIFQFIYGCDFSIKVLGAESSSECSREETELRSLQAFRRTFVAAREGDDRLFFSILQERHPFYNGQVHAKITDDRLSALSELVEAGQCVDSK